MLKDKILQKKTGIITYGITPPKISNDDEKLKTIAETQINRIRNLGIDGLVLYNVQEETERTEEERPFPYMEAYEPNLYNKKYLSNLKIPKIIYRCVGSHTEEDMKDWLKTIDENDSLVFVGAASDRQKVKLPLTRAYKIKKDLAPNILIGGVTIPERHVITGNEHNHIIKKINNGCSFFISQAVFNIENAKNFLSDYYFYCQENKLEMVPIVFTFTPCGSLKTLKFLKWLGINIPKWIENELNNSQDILEQSIELCENIFRELFDFSIKKKIPIGCNIESVSIRKVEIEASINLVHNIKKIISEKLT